jgi:hypothetical protein
MSRSGTLPIGVSCASARRLSQEYRASRSPLPSRGRNGESASVYAHGVPEWSGSRIQMEVIVLVGGSPQNPRDPEPSLAVREQRFTSSPYSMPGRWLPIASPRRAPTELLERLAAPVGSRVRPRRTSLQPVGLLRPPQSPSPERQQALRRGASVHRWKVFRRGNTWLLGPTGENAALVLATSCILLVPAPPSIRTARVR